MQPAIDYYENHGTATEQLRTFYYQGRIYENRGNMSQAILMHQKALERGRTSADIPTKARACCAQIKPYLQLMSFEKAIEVGKLALFYNRQAKRMDSYALCLIHLANTYTLKKDRHNTWKYLNECRKLWPYLSKQRKLEFYNNSLIAVYKFSVEDSILKNIQKYKSNVPIVYWDNLTLAAAYAQAGYYEKARIYLSRYESFQKNLIDDIRYYSILYTVCQHQRNYKEANEAYVRFNELNDSINKIALKESARLAEAQHQLKLDIREAHQARIRNFWIAAGSIVVLLLVVGLGYYRLRLSRMQKRLAEQEKEHYRLQYELLRDEHGSLQQLLADGNRLDAAARDIVRKRLALLNEFFRAHITEDSREPEKHVAQILSDREAFMQSTREGFAVSHPGFIRHLEQKGLTEWEVGYCCLFALGLNGKEVGRYTHFGNHYKINIHIRRKLWLDSHSTNLNLYITRLLRESEEQTAYDIYPNN